MANNSNKSAFYTGAFLINPFISILLLIKNYSKIPNRKSLIVLICGFVGLGFYYLPGHDIYRYIIYFDSYNNSLNEYFYDVTSAFGRIDRKLDFYLDTISFIIKQFSENKFVYLSVLGLIFGIFYSKYLDFFLIQRTKINLFVIIFTVFTVLAINPQLGINYRFFTATAMLTLGFYKFLLESNRKSLILVLLSPLIHIGMLGFMPLLFLIYFLKTKPSISFILLITTFFISTVNFSSYAEFLSGFGSDGLTHKASGYTSERAQERYDIRFVSGGNWFMNMKARFFFFSSSVFLFFIYLRKRNILDKRLRYLLVAASLACAYWNIINSFPMAYRYEPFLVLTISAFLMLLFSNIYVSKFEKIATSVIVLPMLLYVIVGFRIFLQVIPVHFFLSNPLVEVFLESDADVYTFFFK